jgi:hypothetical protein
MKTEKKDKQINKIAKKIVFCREKAICYCNFSKNLTTFAKPSFRRKKHVEDWFYPSK